MMRYCAYQSPLSLYQPNFVFHLWKSNLTCPASSKDFEFCGTSYLLVREPNLRPLSTDFEQASLFAQCIFSNYKTRSSSTPFPSSRSDLVSEIRGRPVCLILGGVLSGSGVLFLLHETAPRAFCPSFSCGLFPR